MFQNSCPCPLSHINFRLIRLKLGWLAGKVNFISYKAQDEPSTLAIYTGDVSRGTFFTCVVTLE